MHRLPNSKWVFFVMLLLGPFVSGGAVDTAKSQFVLCKNKDIVRTIRITPAADEEYSCETVYTKAGADKVVGHAKNISSCENILNNIQENLSEAGWSCKAISGARITAEAP